MFEFKFKSQIRDQYAANVTYEIPVEDLQIEDLLQHFLYFMQAVGYQFPLNARLVVDGPDINYVVVQPETTSDGVLTGTD